MRVILLCSTLQGEGAVKSEAVFKVAIKAHYDVAVHVGGWLLVKHTVLES